MLAERSVRWFLSLFAMRAPLAATTARTCGASEEPATPRADAHVVFRHYL